MVIDRVGDHLHLLACNESRLPVAAAQKIQRAVVRDPEQPPLGIADFAGGHNDSTALTSASCNTSSPSIAEPTMRAQYRCSFGRIATISRSISAAAEASDTGFILPRAY
jgi:hypothetical protein